MASMVDHVYYPSTLEAGQEDQEFKASLSYLVRFQLGSLLSQKKKKKKRKGKKEQ
jgi:hypothetical protein